MLNWWFVYYCLGAQLPTNGVEEEGLDLDSFPHEDVNSYSGANESTDFHVWIRSFNWDLSFFCIKKTCHLFNVFVMDACVILHGFMHLCFISYDLKWIIYKN